MSTSKNLYGSPAQITFRSNLTTLASSATAGEASDAIDETSNQPLDELVQISFTLGSGTIDGTNAIVMAFVYATVDSTNEGYSGSGGNPTGAQAAYTALSPDVLVPLITVPTPNASKAYVSLPRSVRAAFGGTLPPKWGLVIINISGVPFTAARADRIPVNVQTT